MTTLATRQTVLHQDHVDQLTAALAMPTTTPMEQWVRRDALLDALPPLLKRHLLTASHDVVAGCAEFVLGFGKGAMDVVRFLLRHEGWVQG
jgi:hypothetical protein